MCKGVDILVSGLFIVEYRVDPPVSLLVDRAHGIAGRDRNTDGRGKNNETN